MCMRKTYNERKILTVSGIVVVLECSQQSLYVYVTYTEWSTHLRGVSQVLGMLNMFIEYSKDVPERVVLYEDSNKNASPSPMKSHL